MAVLPSEDQICENLRHWYAGATDHEKSEGTYWYPNANYIARKQSGLFGLTLEQTAGVIAVLSPRNHWTQNVLDAYEVLEFGAEAVVRTFTSNLEKALRIIAGDLSYVKGNKVIAFWHCILGSDDNVVVDSWAVRAAIGDLYVKSRDTGITDAQYETIANCYVKVARELGLAPSVLQAIVWVSVRNIVTAPLLRLF